MIPATTAAGGMTVVVTVCRGASGISGLPNDCQMKKIKFKKLRTVGVGQELYVHKAVIHRHKIASKSTHAIPLFC